MQLEKVLYSRVIEFAEQHWVCQQPQKQMRNYLDLEEEDQ
jgi:hypothetical protein